MKKPETKFKEKVLKDLSTLKNVWYFKTQEITRRGIPDFILCKKGFFVAFELKVDSPIDALQEYNLQKIREAGGEGVVVTPTTWPRLFRFIKTLGDTHGHDN